MTIKYGKKTFSIWGIFALLFGIAGYAVEVLADTSSSPTLESASYFGGAGDQRGTGVTLQGGNIYLSGVEGQGSELEALALRFANPPGPSPLWSTRWPNPTGSPAPVDDYFQGVAATAEGVYFPGGSYSQTSDGVGGKESKGILAKFPLTGIATPTWVARPNFFPYTGVEGLHAVAATVESGSPVIYAAGGGQPCSHFAYVIAKFDVAGNLLVKATDPGQENAFNGCSYNGTGSDGRGVTTLNGSVYGVGSRGGFPTIWKHAPNLGVIWRQQDTSIANAQFQGMTAVGNAIYAVGQTYGAAGSEQYVVARYDESGNRIWSRSFGGANSDVLNGAVAIGDRLFVVGYTRSAGAGGSDGVLMEISTTSGDVLSTTYYGGAQDDALRGISSDGTDLYVVGESKSFASASGNAVGQNDLVLLRYTLGPPTLMNITVTPSDPTINVGETQQFTATGTFSDGSSRALTFGAGDWTSLAPIPTARWASTVGAIDGKIVVAGGYNGSHLTVVQAYDTATNTWAAKNHKPATQTSAATGVIGGILYSAGGTNCCVEIDSLWAYNPSTDAWTSKAALPGVRQAASGGVIAGKLHVVGGHAFGAPLTLHHVYDPATNAWTTRSPMPTPRTLLGVGVVNGILYAVGGYDFVTALDTVESYDPTSNTWTARAAMPTPRFGVRVEVINGVLYAVAGRNSSGPLSTVEAYSPASNTWTTVASMPTLRDTFGSAVVDGVLYAIAGLSGAGATAAGGTSANSAS